MKKSDLYFGKWDFRRKRFKKKEYKNLKELLLYNLNSNVLIFDKNNEKKLKTRRSIIALNSSSYFSFNSKERVSLVLFSMDRKKAPFTSISECINYIITKVAVPTYIVETDDNYQFAFHLKRDVFLDKQRSVKKLEAVKRNIISTLGYISYSEVKRHSGMYANALLFEHIYTRKTHYELSDFSHLEKRKPFRLSREKIRDYSRNLINKRRDEISVDISIPEDYCSNVLLIALLNYAKPLQSLNHEQLFQEAVKLNKYCEPPLDIDDLEEKCIYVYKKWEEKKITVFDPTISPAEQIANLREERREQKKRDGTYLSQSQNAVIQSKKRANEKKKIVFRAIRELIEKGEKLTGVKIMEQANYSVSKNIVSKYRKEFFEPKE